MTDGFSFFVKKRVFVILKNKRYYEGVVESVEEVGNGIIWIQLTDKFEQRITFASGEIDVMEEKK